MELVLLVLQIIVALLLIGSVLLQRSDSDGMGLGGASGGGGLLSSRGQANLMTRTTAVLAFIFMSNSLLLGVITARSGASSLVDQVVAEQPKTVQPPKDGGDKNTAPPVVPAEKAISPTPGAAPAPTGTKDVPAPAKAAEAPKAD